MDGGFLRNKVERTSEGGETPGRGHGGCKGSEAELGSACVRSSKNTRAARSA